MARKKADPLRIKSSKVELRVKPDQKAEWEWAADQDKEASVSEWLRKLAAERVAELRGEPLVRRRRRASKTE